jgi:hypothetical protein
LHSLDELSERPRKPVWVKSYPTQEKQNDKNDQDDAENTDTAVTVAVAVTAETATESTKQEDDKDDDEYQSERHVLSPVAQPAGWLHHNVSKSVRCGRAQFNLLRPASTFSFDFWFRNPRLHMHRPGLRPLSGSAFRVASGLTSATNRRLSARACKAFKHGRKSVKTALFSAAVLALVGSAWAQDGMKATTVMPDSLTWKDNPAIPKGGQIAILVGNPTKAGDVVVQRVKFPPITKFRHTRIPMPKP